MGGTPNYERYGRFKIEMAAKESREKKELCGEKFPRCRGTFDTCPSEEELKNLLEKKMAPQRCGRCPIFHESKVKGIEVEPRKLSPEEIEELQKDFGRKK